MATKSLQWVWSRRSNHVRFLTLSSVGRPAETHPEKPSRFRPSPAVRKTNDVPSKQP